MSICYVCHIFDLEGELPSYYLKEQAMPETGYKLNFNGTI